MPEEINLALLQMLFAVSNAFFLYLFISTIYKERFNIKKSILFVLFLSVSTGLIMISARFLAFDLKIFSTIVAEITKAVCIFLLIVFFLKHFLKYAYSKIIIAIVLFSFILIAGNMFVMLIFEIIGLDNNFAKNNLEGLLLGYTIIFSFNTIVITVVKSFNLFSNLPLEIKSKARKYNTINIIIFLLIILANISYYTIFYNEIKSLTPIFINIIIIVLFFVFTVININNLFNFEVRNHELEMQLFYNKTLDSLIIDMRKFKHNFNNIISVINGYIALNKYEELRLYLKEITSKGNSAFSFDNSELLKIKNAGLFGLIVSKLELAHEKDINMSFFAEDEINQINMNLSDFCEALGILLDNSIEAAVESQDKEVSFSINNSNNAIIFSVENSTNKKVEMNSLFQKGFSTRSEKRGLGLWILNSIANKYSNVHLNSFSFDKRFKQELIVEFDKPHI